MDIAIEDIKEESVVIEDIKIELEDDVKIEPQDLVQLVEDIKKENAETTENMEDPLKISAVVLAQKLCIKDGYYRIDYDNCIGPNIDSFNKINERSSIHNLEIIARENLNIKRSRVKRKSAPARNNSCLEVKETSGSKLKDSVVKKNNITKNNRNSSFEKGTMHKSIKSKDPITKKKHKSNKNTNNSSLLVKEKETKSKSKLKNLINRNHSFAVKEKETTAKSKLKSPRTRTSSRLAMKDKETATESKLKKPRTRNNSSLAMKDKETTTEGKLKIPRTRNHSSLAMKDKETTPTIKLKNAVTKKHKIITKQKSTNKSPTKTTKLTVKEKDSNGKLQNSSIQEHAEETKELEKSESTPEIQTNSVLKEKDVENVSVPKVKKKKIRRRIHQCSECSRAFTTRQLLTRHVRIHTDERPFPCDLCPYRARVKGSLVVHLKVHFRENNGAQFEENQREHDFICPVCYKLLSSNRNLMIHSRIHSDERPFQCYHCDACFRSKSSIVHHLRTKHSNRELPTFAKICHVCGKTVANSTSLTRHMATHSAAKPFLCDVCGIGFKTMSVLKDHIDSLHTPTSEKSFRCEYCNYITSRKSTLLKHAKSHIRHSDLVECPDCGKCYTTRLLLKRHILEEHENEN